jgi:hypothetical protein
MRNDRKRPPARYLVGKGAHRYAITVAGTQTANDQAAPTLALDMSSERLFANCCPTALTTKKSRT